eukprot:c27350_g1_i1 orf=294-1853(+)
MSSRLAWSVASRTGTASLGSRVVRERWKNLSGAVWRVQVDNSFDSHARHSNTSRFVFPRHNSVGNAADSRMLPGINQYGVSSLARFYSSGDLPPHQRLTMPSLSPTMTQGNIARWCKKEGDQVSTGDVLCEIETDKATLEMEAMEEGYLAKILCGDGSKDIPVGQAIAVMVDAQGDVTKFSDYEVSSSGSPKASVKEQEQPPPNESTSAQLAPKQPLSKPNVDPLSEDRIFASPIARKLAEENQVLLSRLKGTGPNGRILKADVEEYLAAGAVPAKGKSSADLLEALDYIDIPNSQIRRVTAQRLLLSKQTIPHYYLTVDICVDQLLFLRTKLNQIQEASGGKKISINDFIIKAAALALRKVPQCNSSWTDDFIRQYKNVNIGVAVQTDFGLLVPVVKDADHKGLATIAEDVKTMAEKARQNNLKPSEYQGGTFTVSNLGGPFGIKQFCAIINPPQVCILAVGTAEKRVIPGDHEGVFAAGSFLSSTLSCDHRVVDGAIGAQWLRAFKAYMEDPVTFLL